MNHNKCLKHFLLVFLLINIIKVQAKEIDIYVLGGSLSDQGNIFSAAEAEFGIGLPATDQYYKGRFSNGLNFVDIIAKQLNAKSVASSSGGNNFSYGGARSDYHRSEDDTSKPFPFSSLNQQGTLSEDLYPWTLQGQRTAFLNRKIDDTNGLYIISFGSNDIADLITALSLVTPKKDIDTTNLINTTIEKIIREISDSIEAFVASGAKDILVPNLPNLGVVPAITTLGPELSGLATQLSTQYNSALNEMLMQWSGSVNIIPFDSFSFLTEVVSAPSSFGFLNVSEGCYSGYINPPSPDDTLCDNPDSFVFYDKEHPTEAFHSLFANQLLEVSTRDVLDNLIEHVHLINTHPKIKQGLNTLLNTVQKNINYQKKYSDKIAAWLLRSFIKVIKALPDKEISIDDSDIMIERAEKTLILLKGRL